MKKNDYCVIGVGRFGRATINTLTKLRQNVIAIDISRPKINDISDKVSYAVALDPTNVDAMKEAGIDKIPNAIVAIANDLEANIMTCAILKELRVPNIIARVLSSHHEKILNALGIYNTIKPESHAGKEAALRAVYQIGLEISEISDNYSIIKSPVKNPNIIGKNISDLDLRSKYNVNIILVKRHNRNIFPDSKFKFEVNDMVTFITKNENIKKIQEVLIGNLQNKVAN